jgi:hypothetical protein
MIGYCGGGKVCAKAGRQERRVFAMPAHLFWPSRSAEPFKTAGTREYVRFGILQW